MRKQLIDVLLNRPLSVRELARLTDLSPKEAADDLKHLFRSLKHTEFTAHVEPASCRKCGFTFGPDKLTKPSKCPECRSTWLTEPRISIQQEQGRAET